MAEYGDYYTSGINGFPSNDIPEEEKNAAWHLAYAKAILSLYYRNQTSWGYGDINNIQKNRAYARGTQNISHIRNQVELSIDSMQGQNSPYNLESARKGLANVNWQVVSEIPKLLNILTGIVMSEKTGIHVYAVDEKSTNKKIDQKWRTWVNAKANELLEERGEETLKEETSGFIPENVQELEMFEQMGGLKLGLEVNIQKALNTVFRDSRWDEELLRKIVFELFANNMAFIKSYVDIDGRVKNRFVDVLNLVIEHSPTYEYSDSQFAGEIVMRTIKEVRQLSGIPEEELCALARTSKQWTNAYDSYGSLSGMRRNDGSMIYDNLRIPVLEAEFLNTNSGFYKTKTDKRGNQRTFKEGFVKDFNPDKTPNIKKISELTVHKVSHILNSEYVYDWGEVMAGAPGEKPSLSYRGVRIDGNSLVNQLIPLADMYYLNWVKFQNALAMAPPAGLAYDWDAVSNIMLGGKKLKPKDVLALRNQSGNFPYKRTDPFNNVNTGHLPYQELEGGIGRQFQEFYQSFELFDQLMQRVSGFTDIAAAVSPGERQGKGVSEMAYSSTLNALKPITSRVVDIKKYAAEASSLLIQMISRTSGYETYHSSMGDNSIELLKLGAEEGFAKLGITIIAKPSEKSKAMITEAAMVAMQAGKNGMQSIEMSDFFLIQRMLDMDNTALAELYLAHKEAKSKILAEQSAQAQAQSQAQSIMQQKQMEIQLLEAAEKIKTDAAIRLEFFKEMFKQDSSVNELEKNIMMEYAKSLIAQSNQNAPLN
jgi:hypothetical protein